MRPIQVNRALTILAKKKKTEHLQNKTFNHSISRYHYISRYHSKLMYNKSICKLVGLHYVNYIDN